MAKRYAIVRVEDTCPSGHDGCKVNLVCVQGRNNIKKKWCENCFYGDTKEQLVRKVVQVLKRESGSDGIFISNGRNFQDSKSVFWEDIAKEIVEFLGVEE